MPYPTERVVELVAPERYRAHAAGAGGGRGPRLARRGQLPTFNAYSADGDVTADLVYVNYGMPEDYEQLAKLGVDVKGQDRHRALRPELARHQAEGRLRARRRRLHHLFGSARRRVSSRATCSRGRATGRSRASQRGSVMDMPIIPAIR